jgi:hypothetical protein
MNRSCSYRWTGRIDGLVDRLVPNGTIRRWLAFLKRVNWWLHSAAWMWWSNRRILREMETFSSWMLFVRQTRREDWGRKLVWIAHLDLHWKRRLSVSENRLDRFLK